MTARAPLVDKKPARGGASSAGGCGCGPRACLLALLVGLACLYLALRGAGALLITGDPLKKADAVVALGGGGEWRVVEAVRLIQADYGKALILTEPGETAPGEGMGSRFFQGVAVENGLSPYVIMITEGVQRSTQDEAHAVLALMRKHQLKNVIVVTDPFHTQRARLIFRDAFRGSGLTVRVHPVPNHWYRSDTWFLSGEGWMVTLLEYFKLAGYIVFKQ